MRLNRHLREHPQSGDTEFGLPCRVSAQPTAPAAIAPSPLEPRIPGLASGQRTTPGFSAIDALAVCGLEWIGENGRRLSAPSDVLERPGQMAQAPPGMEEDLPNRKRSASSPAGSPGS